MSTDDKLSIRAMAAKSSGETEFRENRDREKYSKTEVLYVECSWCDLFSALLTLLAEICFIFKVGRYIIFKNQRDTIKFLLHCIALSVCVIRGTSKECVFCVSSFFSSTEFLYLKSGLSFTLLANRQTLSFIDLSLFSSLSLSQHFANS